MWWKQIEGFKPQKSNYEKVPAMSEKHFLLKPSFAENDL